MVVGNREAATKDWLGNRVEAGKIRTGQSGESLSNHVKHNKQGGLGELHFRKIPLVWSEE